MPLHVAVKSTCPPLEDIGIALPILINQKLYCTEFFFNIAHLHAMHQ